MTRTRFVVALAFVVATSGCAPRTPGADVKKLKQRLDELAQDHATAQRQVEDVNNRLFLLEDRVDTSRVAHQRAGDRAPSLPVVRLAPEAASASASASASAPRPARRGPPSMTPRSVTIDSGIAVPRTHGSAFRSVVAHHDVVLSGAAAVVPDAKRPVLRLNGGGARSREHGDPVSTDEKLAVVPMARRPKLASSTPRVPAPRVPAPRVPATTPTPTPQRAYTEARAAYLAGEYEKAAAKFGVFVDRYTDHPYADNALYWLAECSYAQKNFASAAKTFRRVVQEYAAGNKAPAALVKMGFCLMKLKRSREARTVLAQVLEVYPKSVEARLASDALQRIQ